MKTLPTKGSDEYNDLVAWEEEKCMGGITINGIRINGWLYYHLNHWNMIVDEKDRFGNDVRRKQLPDLRDNEWERAEALDACNTHTNEDGELQRMGYMEVGLRQGGKSEFEVSQCSYTATLFENTQNVIVAGNDSDLSLLTTKMDFGLFHMWDGIKIPKLDNDWRKPAVRLGYKGKDNEDQVWSYLMIRNAQEGKKTEAPAGTTAKSFIMDEVGKYPFSQTYSSAKPALIGKFGLRCIPILVGTGGAFAKGNDAERFFYYPEANGFLPFFDKESGKITAKFMSGLYRQDCKVPMKLSDYLVNEKGIELTDREELDKIIIQVSDKDKAKAKILKERADKAKDPDQVEYLKAIMYNPLTPEECFMTTSINYYNGDLARKRKATLDALGVSGFPVELEYEDNKLIHKPSQRLAISSYPIKQNENENAPPVIWEPPIHNAPFGLYTAGVDPYKFDKSSGTSLGAIYIFKRMHDIMGEKFQDMFVASYVARPERKETWNETARRLIKYYNAIALVENDEYSFCQFMIDKGDELYLAKNPSNTWLKQNNIQTTVTREYGIHRSNGRIREHIRSKFKEYMEEPIAHDINPETGNITKEYFGVDRISDAILLEEVAKWNDDGNFDREIAASLAIVQARHMDPIYGKVSGEETDPRYKSYQNKNKSQGSFYSKRGNAIPRGGSIRKLFK